MKAVGVRVVGVVTALLHPGLLIRDGNVVNNRLQQDLEELKDRVRTRFSASNAAQLLAASLSLQEVVD